MRLKSSWIRASNSFSGGWPEIRAPTSRSRSAPAEKLPPAPVMIATRSSGSASSRSQASHSRTSTSGLKALRFSGRFSVMVRTWPSRSTSTAGSVMGPGLAPGRKARGCRQYCRRVDRYQTKRQLLRPLTAWRRWRNQDTKPFNLAVYEAHDYRPSMRRFFAASRAQPDILIDVDLPEGAVVLDVGAYEGEWCQRVLGRAEARGPQH